MADIRVNVRSQGLDRLGQDAKRAERQFKRLGSAGARSGKLINSSFRGAQGGLSRLASAAAGLGVAFGAKAIIDFDEALGKLQARAGLTNQEAFALRDSLISLQSETGLSKEAFLESARVLQDFGGLLKTDSTAIKRLGTIAKATSADMGDLTTVFASFRQTGQLSQDESVAALIRLSRQADLGTVSLKDLASVMPGLIGTAKSLGLEFNEVGAAIQTIGATTGGSADEARTRFNALVTQIGQQSSKLRKLGIDVFQIDPRTGQKSLKSLQTIIEQVFRKTKADPEAIQKIFGNVRARQALAAFQTQFDRETGKLTERAGGFRDVLRGGAAATRAGILKQLQKREQGVGAEADKLKKSLFKLEEAVTTVGRKIINFAVRSPLAAGAVAAGGLVLKKVLPGLLSKLFGRGRGAAGAAGALGVQRVFVVNMPGGALAGAPAAAAGAPGAAGRVAGIARAAFALTGAASAGVALGTALDSVFNISGRLANHLDELSRSSQLAAQTIRNQLAVGAVGQASGRLDALSRQFSEAARRGVTFEQRGGGGRLGAAEQFRRTAAAEVARETVPAEARQALLDKIERLAAVIESNPTRVVVSAAGGIDQPKVTASRRATR